MKRVLCKIEYDGSNYRGWQVQPHAPTLEEAVVQVLSTILQRPTPIHSSSRTDSGVHAKGQVFDFVCPQATNLNKLMLGLNALLPPDIAVQDLVQVDLSFSARRLNLGKRYLYRIYQSPLRRSLGRVDSWWLKSPLELGIMQEGAKLLLGSHDFSAFRGKGCQAKSPLKSVTRFDVESHPLDRGREIRFIIEGNAFLKNQVRIMVGTLFDLGRGKIKLEQVARCLESGRRNEAGYTAPALGLTLEEVFFDPNPFVTRELETWDQDFPQDAGHDFSG